MSKGAILVTSHFATIMISTSYSVGRFLLSIIFSIYLTSYVTSLSAQDEAKIDSMLQLVETQSDTHLIKTYEELFFLTLPKEPQKAKPYLDKAFEELERINSPKFRANLTKNLGSYHYYLANYPEASSFYKEAIGYFEELGNKSQIAAVYNNLGIVLKYMGQPEKALESHQNSLRLKEELGQTGFPIAASVMNIGVIHSELENYELSNEYYRKAEAICIEEDDQWRLSMVRSNIAINLEKEGKQEEALDYYTKSLPFFIEGGYKIEEAKQYNLIGALYFDLDSLNRAQHYFSKAQMLGKEIGELQIEELGTRNVGDVYFEQKRYTAALNNFNKALALSEEAGTDTRRVTTYLRLAKTHAALGNYKQAHDFRKQHFDKYDEVYKQENIDKLNELEVKYQTDKKEQQIVQQKIEIDLLEQKEKTATLQKLALGGGFGLSLIALGFGFYGYRQRMKSNQLEKEKIEAELSFKKKELVTHALHLAKKNEVLESIKQKALDQKKISQDGASYQKLVNIINLDIHDDESWETFTRQFQEVHTDFYTTVSKSYPSVTPNELRLMSLIKMNLSSKEMANILNISLAGIKKARQRLRKKMELETKDSLEQAVLSIA